LDSALGHRTSSGSHHHGIGRETTARATDRVAGLWAVPVGLALARCGWLDSPATTLTPRSDFGWISHRIFLRILRWDTAILLIVQARLFHTVFRFRERDSTRVPRPGRPFAVAFSKETGRASTCG
jgi:hypothetical protein